MNPRLRRPLKTALPLLLAAWMAGCSNASRLQLADNSAPIASLRAVHRIGGGPGGAGLELDVQAVRAKGRQALDAFDLVQLGGRSISGPGTLSHDVRVQHLQLAYNHRLFAGAPVEFEWFAGGALHRLDWRSSGTPADPVLERRRSWWGPAGGVAGRFNLGPITALELRYAAALEYGELLGSRNSTELALALRPVPGVALRLGLAETRSQFDAIDGDSDLVLRARGPFLGLALSF
jgi:hypothetical protein